MKGTIKILSTIFVLGFAACKKDSSDTTSTAAALTASQTGAVKVGQPVSFNFPTATANSAVSWNVSPSTNTQINASGSTASIVFGAKKTTYTVTATYGSTVASTQITTGDSVYNGSATGSTIVPFSTGEQLKLKATRIDSMGTASGIILQVQTANTYNCLNNSLAFTSTLGANSYAFNFNGVSVPAACSGGTVSANGFLYLFPLAIGSTSLSIVFNGTTYTGTIVKTGTSFTINWAYSSGVIISPTTL